MRRKSIKFILSFSVIVIAAVLFYFYKSNNIADSNFVRRNSNNTLVVGSKSWNGNFNPIYASTTYDLWATDLLFDNGLMTNSEKGEPVKWMAKSYTISNNGTTYTFTINKGIKFSNGNEVTAKDFELTYLALADPGYDGLRRDSVNNLKGYEEYHNNTSNNFAGVKVLDKYTIQFVEKSPKASALLEDFIYAPLDHSIYGFTKGKSESLKRLYDSPIGAGPYLFVYNKPENSIFLKKNDKYWRGTPKIDNIKIVLTNAVDGIKKLKNGEIDIDGTIQCNYKSVDEIKKYSYLNTVIYPSNSYGYIGLNLRNPKFSDKRVRQALMYGLNRAKFISWYYKQYGSICNAPVSYLSWAYTKDVKQYEYNYEKACDLLDQAGWKLKRNGYRYKNNKKFTIHWKTYTGSEYVDSFIPFLKSDYRKLGIEVNVEKMQFSTLTDKVFQSRDFEFYNMAWGLQIDPDPSGIFSIAQDVPGGGNSVGFKNILSEQLIKKGLRELDVNKRKKIYKKWLSLINEELPYLFISQGKSMYVYNDKVKGLRIGPYSDWTNGIEKIELNK